jgi:hypothetical protein
MASPVARPSPARTSSLPTRPSVRSVAAVLRTSFSPIPIAVASRNGSPHCTSKHGRTRMSTFSTTRACSHSSTGQCGGCRRPSLGNETSRHPSAEAAERPRPRPPRLSRWCPQTKDLPHPCRGVFITGCAIEITFLPMRSDGAQLTTCRAKHFAIGTGLRSIKPSCSSRWSWPLIEAAAPHLRLGTRHSLASCPRTSPPSLLQANAPSTVARGHCTFAPFLSHIPNRHRVQNV